MGVLRRVHECTRRFLRAAGRRSPAPARAARGVSDLDSGNAVNFRSGAARSYDIRSHASILATAPARRMSGARIQWRRRGKCEWQSEMASWQMRCMGMRRTAHKHLCVPMGCTARARLRYEERARLELTGRGDMGAGECAARAVSWAYHANMRRHFNTYRDAGKYLNMRSGGFCFLRYIHI